MNKKHSENRMRGLLFLLCGVLAALLIVFLKKASGKSPFGEDGRDGQGTATTAPPDTTLDASTLTVSPETISVALPDTIGKDKRPAAEAGYEDGYLSGMDDGAEDQERASYDESSNFPTRAEREAYIKGYREGYAKGFEDGRQGRQFNI